MCCTCCTSLKIGAMWGVGIQSAVAVLLLLRYFLFAEELGDFAIPYIVYIGVLLAIAPIILLAVVKEWECLLKTGIAFFIINQMYGLVIRLAIPMISSSVLVRIATLFVSIILSAIYTFTLVLLARKINHHHQQQQEQEQQQRSATTSGSAARSNANNIEEPSETQPVLPPTSTTTTAINEVRERL